MPFCPLKFKAVGIRFLVLFIFISDFAIAAETAAPESAEGRAPRLRQQAGLTVPEGIVIHEEPRARPTPAPAPAMPPRRRRSYGNHENSPIWKKWFGHFEKCVHHTSCEPAQFGTFGRRTDRHGNEKPSCHRENRAVDIGAIKCNDGVHKAIKRHPKFEKFVKCMRRHMKTIYWDDAAHRDHAHFSFGCTSMGRKMY